MSLVVDLRIQELKLQRNYLQAQLLNGWQNRWYNDIQNSVIQTQLQAVTAELNSLQGNNLDVWT